MYFIWLRSVELRVWLCLWYCGMCSISLRSVVLRVWLCLKPYSQFVCGILGCILLVDLLRLCVLSGWDMLSWDYEYVCFETLYTVTSSVVLFNLSCQTTNSFSIYQKIEVIINVWYLVEIWLIESMSECMILCMYRSMSECMILCMYALAHTQFHI